MDGGTIIIIFIIILIILASTIPMMGITLLIGFFISKSSSNHSPEFLQKQKEEMLAKLNKSKKYITAWQADYLKQISNRINHNYFKGFSKRFNGTIRSSDGEPIIVFRRIDRGFSVDAKIMAATSHLHFYFVISPTENNIYINDVLFGIIKNNTTIMNASGDAFGTMNRDQNRSAIYSIKTQNDTIAEVVKNSDRRTFIKDPLRGRFSENPATAEMFVEQDVSYQNSMINPLRELNEEEYQWVLAIAIFEIVYYGIEFG